MPAGIVILAFLSPLSCGGTDYLKLADEEKTFPSAPGAGDASGVDAFSRSTNHSSKEDETSPKLSPFAGAMHVAPPQINNYGTVSLSCPMETPAGRAGIQPSIGLSYSSSGGDSLAGIGWGLSTGLGVISRTTSNGQLFYDHRDTFTYNGKRLIKVAGPSGSEEGTYRLEIESGFSRFELTDTSSGGVWKVYDRAGRVTYFGENKSERIYRPDNDTKTYIWNFTRTSDLNGNYMTAEYDTSLYNEKHILYLKEIRYTGNYHEGTGPLQYVRFEYKKRDDAYVSKAPGFIMEMDRLLDKVVTGFDGDDLWEYRMVYRESEDSGRPILETVESTRYSTRPEFMYQKAHHSLVWRKVANPDAGDPETNPESTKYFEGDFNGDGISDMVFFNPETGKWKAAEGNRHGGYLFKTYGEKFAGYDRDENIQFFKGNVTGDYNGDGRSDIAFYLVREKEFWVAQHTGKVFSFKRYGALNIDVDIFHCEWFPGDFDGNGLSDAVLYHEPTGEWILMKNSGGAFVFQKFSQHFKHLFRDDYVPDMNMDSECTFDTSDFGRDRDKIFFLSGDYNGDGRTDISIYDSRYGKWWVASAPLSNRTNTERSRDADTERSRDADTERSRDADTERSRGMRLEWNLYKTFTAPEKALFGNDRFSGDFNGDGFSDFLLFDREVGEWILGETGNGTINFRVFDNAPQFKEITRWLQGDFNGDGRTDIGFYSKSDSKIWVGEATPSGFRYRIYNDLNYGPGTSVLDAPLPKDNVKILEKKALVHDSDSSTVVEFPYDGNYHSGRGERVFPGNYTGSDGTFEFLVYKKREGAFYSLSHEGTVSAGPVIPEGIDLERVKLVGEGKGMPLTSGKEGLVYYKEDTSSFHSIYRGSSSWIHELMARLESEITNFKEGESLYFIDDFDGNGKSEVMVLDDQHSFGARFVRFSDSGTGAVSALYDVNGISLDHIFRGGASGDERDLREHFVFFTGNFSGAGKEVLMVDMRNSVHRWYRGTFGGGTVTFTEITPAVNFGHAGYDGIYRTYHDGTAGHLTVSQKVNGAPAFTRYRITSSSVSEESDYIPAGTVAFENEWDHERRPVVRKEDGFFRVYLGPGNCRLEKLTASMSDVSEIKITRNDLLTAVYPFRWIQGDYNGDGKTDIGIFHLKEPVWYFALTRGTVPDMINRVKNGIGGEYFFEYINSTTLDNTGGDGVPDLPMNYRVCSKVVLEDGRGNRVVKRYDYKDGHAFSAFIDGRKETDYFGFGRFTVTDALGGRNVNTYYNTPYSDFRKNRALAGAVKEQYFVGRDNREYSRKEYRYKLHEIVTSPPTPLLGGEGSICSFLIEPVEVKEYMEGTLVKTTASNITLTAGKYEMVSKAESVTDHYSDGVHSAVTLTSYTEFDNIDVTNEMRVKFSRALNGTSHETTTSYLYDYRGNVVRETVSYTGNGLVAPHDKITRHEYDGYGNAVRTIDASGTPSRVTETIYDEKVHQFPVETRQLTGTGHLAETFVYDYGMAFGQVKEKRDNNGNGTYFDYDEYGRLLRQRADTEGGTETFTEYSYTTDFPLSGKVTRFTGRDRIETRVFGDGMGRTIHTVRSAGKDGTYVKSGALIYDAIGRVVKKCQTVWADSDEIDTYRRHSTCRYPTITEYHPSGRVRKVTLPPAYPGEAETSTAYTYNGPWETVSAHSVGRNTRTVKNARGQVLSVEEWGTGDPESGGEVARSKIGFAYDMAGNRVKKMDLIVGGGFSGDRRGRGIGKEKEGRGRGTAHSVEMDLTSPPTPLLGGEGSKDLSGNNVALWRYDGFGRVVESSDPDLGYSSVTYNAFGEAVQRRDALGRITEYRYDRLGRMTEELLPGNEGRTVYRYDEMPGSENALGRVVSVQNSVQKKVFSYDKLGRMKREVRTIEGEAHEYETLYCYDLLGRKVEITYPADPYSGGREMVRYTYGAMGVVSVTAGSGPIVKNTEYNEFGQTSRIDRGNGVRTTYTYDVRGRLTNLLSTDSSGHVVQNVTYAFRVDNTIAAKEDVTGGRTVRYSYAYDGQGRLVDADGELMGSGGNKSFRRSYEYSPAGNLTGKTIYESKNGVPDDVWDYTYRNHAVQRIDTTKHGGRFFMEYDAAGNMVYQGDHGKAVRKEMVYDSKNRIKKVTNPDTAETVGRYFYDEGGFRVKKISKRQKDGVTTDIEVLYPSMYMGIERHTNVYGTEEIGTANNIYVKGVRVAVTDPNGAVRYYLTDQVDSVSVVLDGTGDVVKRFEYLPYGGTWAEEGDDSHLPKFNSQELDEETGYYFYNARHYDPEIGRFVTADIVVDGEYTAAGWNRYMYVKGNPIQYRDPTGHRGEGKGLIELLFRSASAEKGNVSNDVNGKQAKGQFSKMCKGILQKAKDSTRHFSGVSGEKIRDEMENNFKSFKWKRRGKEHTTNYTNIGEVPVYLNHVNKEQIRKTKDETLEVINDMIKGNNLSELTVSSLYRDEEEGKKGAHSDGRGIDVTAVRRKKEYARFRDMKDYKQSNEPGLAKEVTSWLRKDPRIHQVLTPWLINGKPNKNEKEIERNHKHHMHIGVRKD